MVGLLKAISYQKLKKSITLVVAVAVEILLSRNTDTVSGLELGVAWGVVKETEVIEFLGPILNKALYVLHFIDCPQS